jgi:glycosyltransferase involved in cell wall biosynthesis
MKYPNILFFRYDKYSFIDSYFEKNKNDLLCSINIVNTNSEINKLFDTDIHLLITFGDTSEEYFKDVHEIITNKMRYRWLHYSCLNDINKFNSSVNYCFISNVKKNYQDRRVIFSIFTTCYNSYDKIKRAYESVKAQTLKDFEWIVLDDSSEEEHFVFLRNLFREDKRVRLYKRSENSGNIGNVKNEAVSLCRGKYVIELDHDDEILPDTLMDATNVFESDKEIGFVYMDCSNIYEDGKNFKYSDFYGLGYGGYYMKKYNDKWIYVSSTPNINNITLGHIVSVPNHPRIWRKDTLLKIGNYCEYLPICDDYELLLRTAVNTKIAKIHKLGYIQYMNNNSNNFSLIRNSEIQRLRNELTYHCFETYKIDENMKLQNSYEEKYNCKPIWKLNDYSHNFCNKIINNDYKTQYCIIGLETLYKYYHKIKQLYNDNNNDFIVFDNKYNSNDNKICEMLDALDLSNIKCYSMDDCSDAELINYFHLTYKSCDDYHIIHRDIENSIMNITTMYEEDLNIKTRKKITIITPCTRPENLNKIKESIRFEYVDNWIIVYDEKKIKENPNLFKDKNKDNNSKIKEYIFSGKGKFGNSQRNFGMDSIDNKNTYLYFLDDDNIIHPNLYDLLDTIENYKIYTFDQKRPVDIFPYKEYLMGDKIEVFSIDTSMFLIDYCLCENIRWNVNKYHADGLFIMECYSLNRDKWIYINKLMSLNNVLYTKL